MATQVTCDPAPEDAVSQVQFLNQRLGQGGDLLVSSWDGSETGKLSAKCVVSEKPVFSCTSLNPVGIINNDSEAGTRFAAGCLTGNSSGCHTLYYIWGHWFVLLSYISLGVLFTGSWDMSVKSWDTRINGETGEVQIGAKVFAMCASMKSNYLVVCDSDKTVKIYDTRKFSIPVYIRDRSQPVLKTQLRSVDCFPDGTGYCVSSVEGRVAWELFDPALGPTGEKKNFSFKCHRERCKKKLYDIIYKASEGGEHIYPVNAVAFHHSYESFATGGGDGGVTTWDGHSKKRLGKFPGSFSQALSFHPSNPTLAVGLSDGKNELAKPHKPGSVVVRFLKPEDVTPKSKKSTE